MLIFVVGEPDDDDGFICFVSVANKKFFGKTIYDTVEVAMYFFLGLNIEYPSESNVVWEFLQQEIFDVPVQSKGKSSTQLLDLIKKVTGKK